MLAFNAETRTATLAAHRQYQAGEEVFDSYGRSCLLHVAYTVPVAGKYNRTYNLISLGNEAAGSLRYNFGAMGAAA